MKKLLPVLAIVLFLLVTPVLAEKGGEKNNKGNDKDDSPKVSVLQTPSPSCDPSANWKNHGEYVSCVAKLKLGGAVVSEAAKSNVGKKDADEQEEEESPSPSPSSSPSASPSASPSTSPSPSASSSASPTASPSASPAVSTSLLEGTRIEIRALIEVLQNIIKSLQNLI